MNDLRDHPDIERIERTGYAEEPEPPLRCPGCGEELSVFDTVYVNRKTAEIIGCRHCMMAVEAGGVEMILTFTYPPSA